MTLYSQATKLYLELQSEKGFTQMTLDRYVLRLKLFEDWAQDPEITTVTSEMMQLFFTYLKEEYTFPRGKAQEVKHYSENMVQQIQYTHKDFWHWASRKYQLQNPYIILKADQATVEVNPFSQREIDGLLKACGVTNNARTSTLSIRLIDLRDQAIVLILLDTGMTGAELCRIVIGDVNLKSGVILVNGPRGKSHYTRVSAITLGRLTYYLAKRFLGKTQTDDLPLFSGPDSYTELSSKDLSDLLQRFGEVSRIKNMHLRRFRDSFATNYLQNGGDIETLSKLLGEDLNTVTRYCDRSEENLLKKTKGKHISDLLEEKRNENRKW